jgi:hypothetical protein
VSRVLSGSVRADSEAVDANSVDPGILIFAVGDASALIGQASGGDDTVTAFAFSNGTALGDAFTISGRAHGGDDVVSGSGIGGGTAYGDAITISGNGVGGNDHVAGVLAYGDALQMTEHARGGADTISAAGGDGSAWAYGDAETMSGYAAGGDDFISAVGFFGYHEYGDAVTLSGQARGGNDTVAGSAFRSAPEGFLAVMYGDGQTLAGHAQAGNDVLISGPNDEQMWGDAEVVGPQAARGVNRFVFTPQNGHDQVLDFQLGKDHLELDGFGFSGFQDLASHFQPTVGGVLISFDADDDIFVRGVSAGQLTAGDFILA